jgi:hypothetical protein
LLKLARMNALLLSLVLAASSDVPVTPNTPPAETPRLRHALWVQPVGTVLFGLADVFYVPLGANLPLTEKTSLALELTPVVGSWVYDATWTPPERAIYWRVLAAAGPLLSFGDGPLSGPFVEPKLIAIVAADPDYAEDMIRLQWGMSFEMQLGLDVGWQFSGAGWYVAPMLGASAGYCFNCTGESRDRTSSLITPMAKEYSDRRGHRPVVNLNLLRIGPSF